MDFFRITAKSPTSQRSRGFDYPTILPYAPISWRITSNLLYLYELGGARTPDRVLRRYMLYPTELLTRNYFDCIRLGRKYLSNLSLVAPDPMDFVPTKQLFDVTQLTSQI
jgi:hypothetical protein